MCVHFDQHDEPLEKTFGFSMWKSLADFESGREAHPTHIAIFGTFMRVVQTLEFNLKLRLYHEVAVLARDEQEYEYIDCHAATGMLVTLGQTQESATAAQNEPVTQRRHRDRERCFQPLDPVGLVDSQGNGGMRQPAGAKVVQSPVPGADRSGNATRSFDCGRFPCGGGAEFALWLWLRPGRRHNGRGEYEFPLDRP